MKTKFKSLFAVILAAAMIFAAQAPVSNEAHAGNNAKKFVAGLVVGAAVAAALVSNSHQPPSRVSNRSRVNKYGFTTEKVWNRPGCRKLENRCNRGNGNACRKYEERCQIN